MKKVVRVTVSYDRAKTKDVTDLLIKLRSIAKVQDHAYDCMYKCGDLDLAYDVFAYRFEHEDLAREKNDHDHPSKFDIFMTELQTALRGASGFVLSKVVEL